VSKQIAGTHAHKLRENIWAAICSSTGMTIPEFSYIRTGEPIHFSVNAMKFIFAVNIEKNNIIHSDTSLFKFIQNFGMQSALQGKYESYVDTGIYPFLGHNYKVDANVGHLASWTLKNGRPYQLFSSNKKIAVSPKNLVHNNTYSPYLSVYNSVLERRLQSFSSGFLLTLRNITVGDQIISSHIYRLCNGLKRNGFMPTL